MSWGAYSIRKCKNCGNEYEVEESTLIMASKNYGKCPLCHSDGDIILTRSILDVMEEQSEKFKNRPKRKDCY